MAQDAGKPAGPGARTSSSAVPDLTHIAARVPGTELNIHETYFWRNCHTLIILRLIPNQDIYRLVMVDAHTGKCTLPDPFNSRMSHLLKGKPIRVQGDCI